MLDAIQMLLAVVEAGNLSRAARLRGVAVSSVSRKIDALEQELGVALLHRSSRLVMLTDAGEQFLPRARTILAEMAEAKQAIGALNADPRGVLTVTAPSSFGRRHVAPAVLSFLKHYPMMEVVLQVTDQIIDLSAQRVDVAIRLGVLPDSELLATRLAPLCRIVCASPGYLARYGTPASPQELLLHNCLTVASAPAPAGWWSFAGVNGNAALAVHGSLRTDDTECLLQAALAGIGIAHLASWMVNEALDAGLLVPLLAGAAPATAGRQAGIHAVRMPGRSHAGKAQLFIAHLRSAFGEVPYWDQI